MAGFTGILGSNAAQPGSLQLGVGPGGGVTVVSNIIVSAGVVFDVQQGKWKRLTDTVHVAQSVSHANDVYRTIADNISVGQTIAAVPSPYLRLSQTLVEVAYAAVATVRLSQAVVEVAYRRDTRQTVRSNVHVDSVGRPGAANSQSLTSPVTVAQTIAQRNTKVRLSVTNNVSVAQAIAQRNTSPRLTVTSTVTVAQTISQRNTHPRLSVTSNVTTAQSFIPAGVHNLFVTSAITVGQTVALANTVNRITVTSAITTTTGVGYAGISDFISSHDTLTVSQTIGVRSTINRQSVTSTIGVSSNGSPKDAVYNLTVTSNVGVGQTPAGRNTNVRLSVTSSIHAGTPTGERDDQNRKVITSPVNVASIVNGRNTNNRISVTDSISIPSEGFFGPKMTVNPNQQTVFEILTVGQTVALQSSNPHLFVADSINVGQQIGNNQLFFQLHDNVGLSHALTGGGSNRNITVSDFATVTPNAVGRNATNHQGMTSRVIVNDRPTGQGPLVSITVTDLVHIASSISQRSVPAMAVSDHVTVSTATRFAGATNQRVTSNVSVVPSMRVSPVVQALLDTIHVDAKLTLAEITTHQFVHVNSAVHFSLQKYVTQSLNFTQTVVGTRVFNRTIKQSLGLSQQLDRSMTYERSVLDRLVFPESGINRPISLPPGQIIVPVASGTLVDNIVILQSSAGAITLPKPEFNDAQNNVNEMKVKRTMTGLTYTFIKSTDRGNLNYVFKIPTLKALELRSWVIASLSEAITLTNWKGEVWLVRFSKNPFEMTNAARWAPTERVEVEIELEGVKISG